MDGSHSLLFRSDSSLALRCRKRAIHPIIRSSDGGISRVIPLKELLHGAWLAVLIPSPSMWLALSRHLRHTGWTFGSVRYPHHRISIDSRRPAGWRMDRTTA